MHTTVWAYPLGQPKAKQKMRFDIPSPGSGLPLFDVAPATLLEIAARVRSNWGARRAEGKSW